MQPTEIIIQGKYYLYYVGRDKELPDTSAIGLAISDTGLPNSYKKVGKIIKPSFGNWDKRGLFDPYIYKLKDAFMLMYTGWDGSEQRWGYATSKNLIELTLIETFFQSCGARSHGKEKIILSPPASMMAQNIIVYIAVTQKTICLVLLS